MMLTNIVDYLMDIHLMEPDKKYVIARVVFFEIL